MKKIFIPLTLCTILFVPTESLSGTCSGGPDDGSLCVFDADCSSGICIENGDGGSGSSCYETTDCRDGFYCDLSHSFPGICTPYPDCSSGCPDCETSSWSNHSTGYQKRTVANCNTLTCICSKKTEYRCAEGYYGSSTNGTSGCIKCPSLDGISGNSASGTQTITNCYIPANTNLSDSAGTYVFTPSNCYYSN